MSNLIPALSQLTVPTKSLYPIPTMQGETGTKTIQIPIEELTRGTLFADRRPWSQKATTPVPSGKPSLAILLLYTDSLGSAFYQGGDLDLARLEYEKLTHLTAGKLSYGDIYSKSFYMLGKIYEQQGDTTKAIEFYEKFLDLWKDADPGRVEVEDAKERLAAIRSQ